jgi:hypothetical protein
MKMENEWGITTREVSTAELDALASEYNKKRLEYEGAKAISNDLHAHMESAKFELIKLLQAAGKTKYEAEGVGKITLVEKLSVTTPKTLEDKAALFGWLKVKFGEDYLAYLSINHQTLNSLYNQELKEVAELGAEFNVPGLEPATTNTELRFSKTK